MARKNKSRDVASTRPEVSPTQLWRVITRRVISKEGVAALQQRLRNMQLKSIKIQSQEDVTMHAFDDAVLFKQKNPARTAAKLWNQHGIETTVIKAQAGVYLVGLGRFYQAKYAEGMQARLHKIGRKFRYQQRTVPIPVWRYTFAPTHKAAAESLWKKMNASGVMMPVLMPEIRFQELYRAKKKPAD